MHNIPMKFTLNEIDDLADSTRSLFLKSWIQEGFTTFSRIKHFHVIYEVSSDCKKSKVFQIDTKIIFLNQIC